MGFLKLDNYENCSAPQELHHAFITVLNTASLLSVYISYMKFTSVSSEKVALTFSIKDVKLFFINFLPKAYFNVFNSLAMVLIKALLNATPKLFIWMSGVSHARFLNIIRCQDTQDSPEENYWIGFCLWLHPSACSRNFAEDVLLYNRRKHKFLNP